MDNIETMFLGRNRLEFLHKGKRDGKPVLFLHGFGVHPDTYSLLTDSLPEHEIFAPSIYGKGYLENQPESLDQCVEMTKDFAAKIPELQGEYDIVGHSVGGTVALYIADTGEGGRLALANPMLPQKYLVPVLSFALKANVKTALQVAGLEGGIRGHRMGRELLKQAVSDRKGDMSPMINLINSFGSFSYKGLAVGQPTLLLYSDDILFNYVRHKKKIASVCKDIRSICFANDASHDSLLWDTRYSGSIARWFGYEK